MYVAKPHGRGSAGNEPARAHELGHRRVHCWGTALGSLWPSRCGGRALANQGTCLCGGILSSLKWWGQAGRHRQPLACVMVLSKFRAEWCRAPAPSSRDLVWPVPRPREPVGHRPPPGPPQRHRGTPEAEGSAPKFMNMHGARAGAELRADQTGTDRSPCRCRSLPRARPPPFTTTVRRRVHYSDETTGEASGRAEGAASPPPTSHAPQEVSGAGSLQQRKHICLCQR